jgi:hypothetical protein
MRILGLEVKDKAEGSKKSYSPSVYEFSERL